MNVAQLKTRLNGFKDNAVVLIEDFTMREIHEVKSVNHDRMCEWIEQQMRDVCVLSINESRSSKLTAHQSGGRVGSSSSYHTHGGYSNLT